MIALICGRNSVMEAIENKVPLKVIYTTGKLDFKVEQNVEIRQITKKELDKLSDNANHQGIAAEMIDINYYDMSAIDRDKPERVLILDHIQDPHNLGAILRSANASGVKHIIIPKDRAAKVTPTVLKVASGGLVGTKIIRVNSLFEATKWLKERQFWIYASALDEKSKPIDKVVFNANMAIIVGNEQTGVSATLLKIADEKFFIPMKGTVQSLNVSVATGIILFSIK